MNRPAPTLRALRIELLHLYRSPAHVYVGHHGRAAGDTPMEEVESLECLAGKGIMGDRYFNHGTDFKGQITFFAREVFERLSRELNITGQSPAVFRRNVITRGVDLNDWIGREFELQGVHFLGTEECRPCYWMERAFGPGAEAALRGCGGLRARILTDGVLRRTAPSAA